MRKAPVRRKDSFNPRQQAIAEIVWNCLRRNKDYVKAQRESNGRNKIYRNGFGFDYLQSQRDWGLLMLIPPEKKFGERFRIPFSNLIAKGRDYWTAYFSNYVEPVVMEWQKDGRAKCLVNLNFPRPVIIDRFKITLSKIIQQAKEKRNKTRFRLRRKGKEIALDYYTRLFSIYDQVERVKSHRKARGLKKILWKTLRSDMNEKQVRDAYHKAEQLIEGGFRLIS